jgi:hypothetical protein
MSGHFDVGLAAVVLIGLTAAGVDRGRIMIG